LLQLKNRILRSARENQTNTVDSSELQAAEKIIAERAAARENPTQPLQMPRPMCDQTMHREEIMHGSNDSGSLIAEQQNNGQPGGMVGAIISAGGLRSAEDDSEPSCPGNGSMTSQDDLLQLMERFRQIYHNNSFPHVASEGVGHGLAQVLGTLGSPGTQSSPLLSGDLPPMQDPPCQGVGSSLGADPSDEFMKCFGSGLSFRRGAFAGGFLSPKQEAPYGSAGGSESIDSFDFSPQTSFDVDTHDCWVDGNLRISAGSFGHGVLSGNGAYLEGGVMAHAASPRHHRRQVNNDYFGQAKPWDDTWGHTVRSPESETTASSFSMGMAMTSASSAWSRQLSEPAVLPSQRNRMVVEPPRWGRQVSAESEFPNKWRL